MRLLRTYNLEMVEFAYGKIPEYAILSHRWGKDELTLQDVESHTWGREGFEKLQRFCARAKADNFEYVWIDTCCIDKTSSAELSEAINSMYRWYYKAERCYAHLADVPFKATFENSEWFTRGWTLQELIAPSKVFFLDENWADLGTKESLQIVVSGRTGIPLDILSGDRDLETASIAQKMSWAAERQTTRVEDRAYCLMGIFGINMPLLYGEGERAFIRLQEEVMKISDDHSLFAWQSSDTRGGLLATSPAAFLRSRNIVPFNPFATASSPFTVSSRGVYLELRFIGRGPRGLGMAILHCKERGGEDMPLAIYVRDLFLTMERFERLRSEDVERIDVRRFRPSQYPMRRICIHTRRVALTRESKDTGRLDSMAEKINTYGTVAKLMDFSNPTALLRAAQAGREDIVWLLLTRSDVDANMKDTDGQTAISHAVNHNHEALVKMLLARSDVTVEPSILPRAAALGHNGILEALMNSDKVDIESKDGQDMTALTWACRLGNEVIVKVMLDKGANTEVGCWGPLVWAVAGEHETIVQLLLDRGADTKAVDQVGRTPLFWAVMQKNQAIAELLLDTNAYMETSDQAGRTPLAWAAQQGNQTMVKILLEKGARPGARDHNGGTPLMLAAKRGHEAVVKLLLGYGAHIDARDPNGRTALRWAIDGGNEAVIKLLSENGASTSWKDRLYKWRDRVTTTE
ncbi:hypothetical protein CDD83_2142 [Cordyceps sp. RAO-2017]|nr:hypothetical protein CDD83_2142 [Cordyceps sp. RAO-2017]